MGIDDCGIARIVAGQTQAFRRHRKDQRCCANQNVVKVHVLHGRRDARLDGLVIQALAQRVIGFDETIDNPREPPVVVFALLHHDSIHLGRSALWRNAARIVRQSRPRIETTDFSRAGARSPAWFSNSVSIAAFHNAFEPKW